MSHERAGSSHYSLVTEHSGFQGIPVGFQGIPLGPVPLLVNAFYRMQILMLQPRPMESQRARLVYSTSLVGDPVLTSILRTNGIAG